ncbi:hypothetical protein [Nocardioides sp. B-3]|uniref:hypothetical protein n=1 Tax=Nocardioides sp. B-3 TaxID=2895565 RepID=UPI003FA5CD63
MTSGEWCRDGPELAALRACCGDALDRFNASPSHRDGWERALPIDIGENAWLAAGVIVGPGVTIGRNTVVGAGSLVLSDLPDHVVAAGSPAVVLRKTPVEP